MKVEIAIREPCVLGESPAWDEASQALWWVDIRAPAIHRWSPATDAHARWLMPALVGSIVRRAQGGLLVGLQTGFHNFDPANGELALVAQPEALLPKNRPNDAKCDRAGRFWCGTMEDFGANARGTLYRWERGRGIEAIEAPFFVPNSLAFSADGKRMFFTDTRQGDILRFDYDTASGTRGPAQVLLPLAGAPGRPDGACIDSAGCLWSARYGGGAIVRITPAGKLDRVIDLPTTQPTSCAFGGPRLDELYITTAAQKLTPEQLSAQPAAGALLVCRPGVSGVTDAAFAG